MLKHSLLFTSYCLLFTVLLSGCVVRTYSLTKDRVDQELTAGNRGYLKGEGPSGASAERKKNRTTQVVEIELRPPIKFEKMPKAALEPQVSGEPSPLGNEEITGNRGYITKAIAPEIAEYKAKDVFEKYTVQKNDTLQKISQRFYGTSKKWLKIYEANKSLLKGPDKVYPGQVLNMPVNKVEKNIK